MEDVILRKLDDMFHDLREDIKKKHLEQVHQPKEHEEHCGTHSGSHWNVSSHRRHSMPCHPMRRDSLPNKSIPPGADGRRKSVPVNGGVAQQSSTRRSSLPPSFPSAGIRRDSLDASRPQQRRDSSSSTSSHQRKFSRDSIDLNAVVEDDNEMDPDYDRSIILEEDEGQFDDEVCSSSYDTPHNYRCN